ncbi:hypothetical protein AAC387_Pa01g0586 [Persea americana]
MKVVTVNRNMISDTVSVATPFRETPHYGIGNPSTNQTTWEEKCEDSFRTLKDKLTSAINCMTCVGIFGKAKGRRFGMIR